MAKQKKNLEVSEPVNSVTRDDSVKIDYVVSGFAASFRLGSPNDEYAKGISEELVHSTRYLEDKVSESGIIMSGLFNGFTEENYATRVSDRGVDFKNLYSGGMYVDSGGLQVMTQGKIIDAAMREQIYKVQAKYGHYAMSFDVIPSEFLPDGQKIYYPDRVHGAGIQAGLNLKEQIKIFKELETKCKIMPIIQGIGHHDMNLYSSNMFNQLNSDEMDYIESVAFGGGTSGFEFLNRMMNGHSSEILKSKMNHVHLLGVTSFQRLLPPVIAAKNGILPGVKKLSFDSTTFSKSYILGTVWSSVDQLHKGIKSTQLGKKVNDQVMEHYTNLWNFWKDNPHNIFDSVEDLLDHSLYNTDGYTTGFQQCEQRGVEHGIKTIVQKHVFVYYNTYNFIKILEAYLSGDLKVYEVLGENYKTVSIMESLEQLKSVDDYEEWFKLVKRSIKIDVPTVGAGNNQSASDALF